MDIYTEHLKQFDIRLHAKIFLTKALMTLDTEHYTEQPFLVTVCQKTIVADLLKSLRKDMHHEAADELFVGDGHFMSGV